MVPGSNSNSFSISQSVRSPEASISRIHLKLNHLLPCVSFAARNQAFRNTEFTRTPGLINNQSVQLLLVSSLNDQIGAISHFNEFSSITTMYETSFVTAHLNSSRNEMSIWNLIGMEC